MHSETRPLVWLVPTGLTLAAAALQTLASSLDPPIDLPDRMGVRLVDVTAGDWWRVLPSPFVSSRGWPHALLNTAGFLLVARPVERVWGGRMVAHVFAAASAAAFAAGVYGHGVVWLSAGGSGAVLGFAGFIVANYRKAGKDALAGALLVLGATFVVPAVLWAVGVPNPGSVPAHLGGLAAGGFFGLATQRLHAPSWAVATAVITGGVLSLVAIAPALRPRAQTTMACSEALRSDDRRSDVRTRLMFVNESAVPLFVYWVRYDGLLSAPAPLSASRSLGRNRLPFYGHDGATYLVADGDGHCLVSATAGAAPGTVRIRTTARDPHGCGATVDEPLACSA